MWQIDSWAWRKVIAAALGLGLAFSAKLSILTFAPIMAVVAMLPLYPEAWSGSCRLATISTTNHRRSHVNSGCVGAFRFSVGTICLESEVFPA